VKVVGKSLSALASLVGGRVIGDKKVEIQRVASIDEAAAGDITFLTSPRYQTYLQSCKASAIIIGNHVTLPSHGKNNFLLVDQPYLAFAKILDVLTPKPHFDCQISPDSSIGDSAVLGENVTVFPHVYVGQGVKVISPATASSMDATL